MRLRERVRARRRQHERIAADHLALQRTAEVGLERQQRGVEPAGVQVAREGLGLVLDASARSGAGARGGWRAPPPAAGRARSVGMTPMASGPASGSPSRRAASTRSSASTSTRRAPFDQVLAGRASAARAGGRARTGARPARLPAGPAARSATAATRRSARPRGGSCARRRPRPRTAAGAAEAAWGVERMIGR